MRAIASIIMILLCVFANTYPRFAFTGMGIEGGDLFCQWQAASFVFMAIAGKISTKNKWVSLFWDFAILVAFGNWIDEVYKVAMKFLNSEKIFAALISLYTITRLILCRTSKSN